MVPRNLHLLLSELNRRTGMKERKGGDGPEQWKPAALKWIVLRAEEIGGEKDEAKEDNRKRKNLRR
jgi:hypothetical protein